MSAVLLEWRNLSYDPRQFFVVGTELNAAAVPGTLHRFVIYETRGYPRRDGPGDVYYAVRDAYTVSEADVRIGKRPKVVARFDTADDAVTWAQRVAAEAAAPAPG